MNRAGMNIQRTGGQIMSRYQRALTLDELIRVVAECSRNDCAVSLTVADLMQRGVVVRARPSIIRAMLRTVDHNRRN
jgi:hypothetical protein